MDITMSKKKPKRAGKGARVSASAGIKYPKYFCGYNADQKKRAPAPPGTGAAGDIDRLAEDELERFVRAFAAVPWGRNM